MPALPDFPGLRRYRGRAEKVRGATDDADYFDELARRDVNEKVSPQTCNGVVRSGVPLRMPRPGGEADKLGNRYEGLWTVDAALPRRSFPTATPAGRVCGRDDRHRPPPARIRTCALTHTALTSGV